MLALQCCSPCRLAAAGVDIAAILHVHEVPDANLREVSTVKHLVHRVEPVSLA